MKLLARFSLVYVLVFSACAGIAAYLSYGFLQNDAREQVLQQARLMMETMRAARAYTSDQVSPIAKAQEDQEAIFLPQTVPAYAATETFNYLRKQYGDYAYKEATLNPTNLRDRAVDWEADVINTFRNQPAKQELIGERNTPTGRSMFLAVPISVGLPCLDCHDRAQTAPAAMIQHYGSSNGFGWQLNEIVGAQIVSVPFSLPLRIANSEFSKLMGYLAGIFIVSLVLLDLLLFYTIVRPVGRLSAMADQISLGNLEVPELPVTGKDEISSLADSFNRMRRSLVRAMKMLEGQ